MGAFWSVFVGCHLDTITLVPMVGVMAQMLQSYYSWHLAGVKQHSESGNVSSIAGRPY